jgi:hypothetical protein
MIRIRPQPLRLFAFQIAPVIGARPVAGELLARVYRVVAVDEDERLAGSQCVESGEDHRVPLGFGDASHIEDASGVSSQMGIGSTHVLTLFL